MLTQKEQDDFYREVGALIKKARQKEGHKQEFVSHQIGLVRTSLANIEKGTQKIQLHTLLELAKVLKVKVDELLPESIVPKESSSKNRLSKEVEQVNNPEIVTHILNNFLKVTKHKK